jgi:hypothetical protein
MADELIPGRDYYVENGRWVFTEFYLRRRGYCCQSGCRHCPYGFRKPAPDDRERDGGKQELGRAERREPPVSD